MIGGSFRQAGDSSLGAPAVSLVAQVVLDTALLRPTQAERIDTLAALEELRRVSFIDEHIAPRDGSVLVSVSLVTSVFGRRKLSVSSDRIEIESHTRFLHKFGAMQPADLQRGIEPRIQRFFRSLSEELAKGKLNLATEMPAAVRGLPTNRSASPSRIHQPIAALHYRAMRDALHFNHARTERWPLNRSSYQATLDRRYLRISGHWAGSPADLRERRSRAGLLGTSPTSRLRSHMKSFPSRPQLNPNRLTFRYYTIGS
jgi:hypothetical protein